MNELTIKKGNLPDEVSIFSERGFKFLKMGESLFQIPDGEEMEKAVEKREMEQTANELASEESRLGKLKVHSKEYENGMGILDQKRSAFQSRFGGDWLTAYNRLIARRITK